MPKPKLTMILVWEYPVIVVILQKEKPNKYQNSIRNIDLYCLKLVKS